MLESNGKSSGLQACDADAAANGVPVRPGLLSPPANRRNVLLKQGFVAITSSHASAFRSALRRSGNLPRYTPLRSCSPLKHKTRIRLKSTKQRALDAMWRAIARVAIANAGGRCLLCIAGVCTGRAVVGHHRKLKSQGGTDSLENCVASCHACHWHVHHYITESVASGAIESRKAGAA